MSKKVVFSLLKKLTYGHIRLIENDHEVSFGNSDANIKATINVHDQKAYSRIILWGGSIGAIENDHEVSFGNSDANIKATINVHDQKAYSRIILWGGSIGAGEAIYPPSV